MENTIYYCPCCSDPWSDEYCTDKPTVYGNDETGWTCNICNKHTFAPEEDLCIPE